MASDSRRSMSGCVDPRNVRSKPVLPVARRTSARSIPLIRIPFARTSRLTSLPLDRQAGGLRRVHPHFPALQSDPLALSGASHRKQTLCINWIYKPFESNGRGFFKAYGITPELSIRPHQAPRREQVQFPELSEHNPAHIERFQMRKAGMQEQSLLRISFLPSLFNPSSACCRGLVEGIELARCRT